MDMSRRTTWIATLFVLSVPGIGTGHAQTITLDEFVAALRQSHPIFAQEQRAPQIEIERRRGLQGAEDWNLAAEGQLAHEEPSIALFGPEETNRFSARGSLDRAFWKTGGRFSASYAFNRAGFEISTPFEFPDSYYEHVLSLSYVHPLLRNSRGYLDQLAYDLKQYDIDLAEVQAREEVENFLTQSIARFLDWVFLQEQQEIVRERLRLSQEELGRTQDKREANLVDQADVIRAEDAVRIWKQNLVLVEAQARALQAELAVLTQSPELNEQAPRFDLYARVDTVTLAEATRALEEESRLLELLRVQHALLAHQRSGYVDLERPDLSLIAGASLQRADASFGEALQIDRPSASIGLRFQVPLKNRTARSEIARTDLQLAQLTDEIADVTIELVSAYTNLHIQMTELQKVLQLNREQIESARERTTEELRLYNQGRGELTFVIQSRDNEQNARLTYAQNALTYQKLWVQAQSLADRLYIDTEE
jgi:outer membrane protein TolC